MGDADEEEDQDEEDEEEEGEDMCCRTQRLESAIVRALLHIDLKHVWTLQKMFADHSVDQFYQCSDMDWIEQHSNESKVFFLVKSTCGGESFLKLCMQLHFVCIMCISHCGLEWLANSFCM